MKWSTRSYSEAEISRLSRKELEQSFMRLQEINQELDFKTRAEEAVIYLAEMVKGRVIDSSHVAVSANRDRLEIKYSKLVPPDPKKSPFSLVWKWNRLLGDYKNKVYDRLILVGEATVGAKEVDRQNGREPRRYEFFDLSFAKAQSLAQETKFHTFQVNTNSQRVGALPGRIVWEHHIELEELVQRYSTEKKP